MKKVFLWLMVVTVVVSMVATFSLAGCKTTTTTETTTATETTAAITAAETTGAAPTEAAKPVTIQFMETLTSPDRTEYVKGLIKDFESKNANIKVELVSVPWEQAHDKIMTQLAAKQLPDVVEMADNWMGEMAATGSVEDLGPYFDKLENKDNFLSSGLNIAKAYKNTLYSLPYGLFISCMFYRQDWLKENSLQVPKTYEELFATAEKLTNPAKNRYGFSYRGGLGAWTQIENLLMTQSGASDYFDANGKSFLRDPKAIEAFKQYNDLYYKASPKDSLNWGYNEMVNAFTSDITGFLFQDAEVIGSCQKTMKEGTFAIVPLPVGPDGKRRVVGGFIGYSIFSTSKNKDAAWKFISYMTSDSTVTDWNKKTNTNPANKVALKDKYFNEGYIKAWTDAFVDSNTILFNRPLYLPEWGQFFAGESVNELQSCLLKKQTAEETMNKWATYLEDAYKKYNKK